MFKTFSSKSALHTLN